MSNYCECHININCEWCRLTEQNKRYRKAIDYVMTAEITHYDSVEQLLADVKYVIEKTLEGE